MYNKLFTKILDSSIWLESTTTRIVWLTFLAAMDEDGYAHFAAIGNLANRARVTEDEAREAVSCLEAPDENSSNKENEGRRIERVPGGWVVLNAKAHQAMVTRSVVQEQTRERVRKYREKRRATADTVAAASVTQGNAALPSTNATLTPSDTYTDTKKRPPKPPRGGDPAFDRFWTAYPKKVDMPCAVRAWRKLKPSPDLVEVMLQAVVVQGRSSKWQKDNGDFIPNPATWLNGRRWEDVLTAVSMVTPPPPPDARVRMKTIECYRCSSNFIPPWKKHNEGYEALVLICPVCAREMEAGAIRDISWHDKRALPVDERYKMSDEAKATEAEWMAEEQKDRNKRNAHI